MATQPFITDSYANTNLHGHHHRHHSICWKSILAGLFIAIMSMMAATALGFGIIGAVTRSAIENESRGGAIATGAGLWLFLSVIISLFLGGFFAARGSETTVAKVGGSQGLVVASLFFVLMMCGAGNAVSGISSGLGQLVKGLGNGASDISQNPMVQDTIDSAIPRDSLKTDPKTFAQGLTTRLLRGDVESAKVYYAVNTGVPAEETDAKIAELKAKFGEAAKKAGDQAAEGLSAVGWTLFVTFLVGLASALGGGIFAAHRNIQDPVWGNETTAVRT